MLQDKTFDKIDTTQEINFDLLSIYSILFCWNTTEKTEL